MYVNVKYEKAKHPEEFARRAYEILDRLPLFVERSVSELLFGYQNDETLDAMVEVNEIFKEYNAFLIVQGFFSSAEPDPLSYKNMVFSIINAVRIKYVFSFIELLFLLKQHLTKSKRLTNCSISCFSEKHVDVGFLHPQNWEI